MAARSETSWGGTGNGKDINLPIVTEGGEGYPDGFVLIEDIGTEADGKPVAKSE